MDLIATLDNPSKARIISKLKPLKFQPTYEFLGQDMSKKLGRIYPAIVTHYHKDNERIVLRFISQLPFDSLTIAGKSTNRPEVWMKVKETFIIKFKVESL